MSGPNIKFAYRAEAALVGLLIRLLRLFPPALASRLGGAVAGAIGPLIPVSRVADQNLQRAMPELDRAARQRTVRASWRNLGQTAAELVRIGDIHETSHGPGYEVVGWDEHVAPLLAKGGPCIFITGHIGNWEIIPPAAFAHGADIAFMYRAASNPLVNDMILRLREANFGRKVLMFPKGSAGARAAYAHLAKGGTLGMLVDQKLDTGLSVPFFGRPAMTMDAMARFALKFRCPVFPLHVVRDAPARLRVICEPAMPLPNTGDLAADRLALTAEMNQMLERWIRERPGAWLWLHRRWPKGG